MDIESFFQDSLNAIKSGIDAQLTGFSANLAVRKAHAYALLAVCMSEVKRRPFYW